MTSWWRRNRIWLALLLPALALALAASSFRLVRLYLPWEWSQPIVADATTGTLQQPWTDIDGTPQTRNVTVTADMLTTASASEGLMPAEGSTLWLLHLTFSADADQSLSQCTVELVDAEGVRYTAGTAGTVEDPAAPASYGAGRFDCVPVDTSAPRPASWTRTAMIVIPDGRTPVAIRIGWTKPVYLVLDTPS